MPAQPRTRVAAAPLYPVCDPSPRDGIMAGATTRAWTQSRPGTLGGSLARDITILRRGLDGHLQRQRLASAGQRRRRLWMAWGGLGLGFLCGVASLFF